METERQDKLFLIVILFLLGTTLFNTLRANRVEEATTNFRKEATYQLALTREALKEQKKTNAQVKQQLAQVLEAQAAETASE